MTESQVLGTRCTCTGGPYLHGPDGLALALSEIAAIQEAERQDPQPAGEDSDDD